MKQFVVGLIRPIYRWLLRATPPFDPWERVTYRPPASRFGAGSRQHFDWYLRGESVVAVASVDEIVAWLVGCEYASDESLFQKADHLQGFRRRGGHAWDVFRHGGRSYLLEAAAKSSSRVIQPLDAVKMHYRPENGVGRDLKTFAFAGMAETFYEHEFKTRRPSGPSPGTGQ